MQTNNSIEELNLSHTRMTYEAASGILDSLRSANTSLLKLDISQNNLFPKVMASAY